MTDVTASRTLVKSPPELWTECSQAESLGRHLDSFGEIRITRLEPESTVAWEGELASGTVRLEPSGWGTRVVLTATPSPPPVAVEAPEMTEPVETSEPAAGADRPVEAEPEPEPELRAVSRERGLGAWLRRMFGRHPPAVAPQPEAVTAPPIDEEIAVLNASPEPDPELAVMPGLDPEAALDAALDSLGRAHHRPFSRV